MDKKRGGVAPANLPQKNTTFQNRVSPNSSWTWVVVAAALRLASLKRVCHISIASLLNPTPHTTATSTLVFMYRMYKSKRDVRVQPDLQKDHAAAHKANWPRHVVHPYTAYCTKCTARHHCMYSSCLAGRNDRAASKRNATSSYSSVCAQPLKLSGRASDLGWKNHGPSGTLTVQMYNVQCVVNCACGAEGVCTPHAQLMTRCCQRSVELRDGWANRSNHCC